MFARVVLMILALPVANAALAQPAGRPSGDRPGVDRTRWIDRMFERVARQLELDDQQRAVFDKAVEEQREELRETMETWRRLREAQQADDRETVERLRSELSGRGPGAAIGRVLAEMEPLLHEDQVPKLWEIQDRMQRRRQMRETYRALTRDLPQQLELSDEQRQQYDDLLREQREKMRERWQELRPLFEELRQAEADGDQERVAELRREFDEARPDMGAAVEEFLARLPEILDESQQQKLTEFREQFFGAGESEQPLKLTIRDVFRAAHRLRLAREQREELRDLERAAVREYRRIKPTDKEAHARLADEVREQVAELLDADQLEQFEQYLHRYGRRGH